MVIDPIISALLAIMLGLVLAIAGYHLLKGFVCLLGALILGGAAFVLGLWVGGFVAGTFGLIIAIVLGIIGAVIGAILAVALATVVLAVGFGIVSFTFGISLGERLDLPGIGSIALGAVLGMVGAFLFLILAKVLVKAATSILGGFIVASGAFYLLDRVTPLGDAYAFVICIGIMLAVSSIGFIVQSGAEGKRGSKQKKHRDKDGHRKRNKK